MSLVAQPLTGAPRQPTRSTLRRAVAELLDPVWLAMTVVLVGGGVALGAAHVDNGAFASSVELFGTTMVTPVILVAPLVAALLGARRMWAEVGHRHLVAVRMRTSLAPYLASKVAAAGLAAFVPFALTVAVPFTLIVGLGWTPPGAIVDPELIGVAAEQAARGAITAATFTQLLAVGPEFYGVVYATWVGLAAAASAMLATVLLAMLPSRALAVLLPFAIVLGESLVAGLLGHPHAALVFVVYPFGLAQGDLGIPALVLGLGLLVAAALAVAVARTDVARERLS